MRPLYVLLLVGCGAVFKPPMPDRRLLIQVQGSTFASDRGYRFAALPEPQASVVRLDVRYPIGSAHDPVGKAGMAHLVEHLVFELEIPTVDGTSKTSVGAELGRVALAWNAATYPDYTSFEYTAAPEALDELMRLHVESMRLGCTALPRETFERERGVVVAELRERYGSGGADFATQVNAAVYPAGHPYRHTDTPETVAGITYEEACTFMASTYRQGEGLVVASGSVTAESLQAAAGKHLGRAPKRPPSKQVTPPLAPALGGTVRIKGDSIQPTLIVTWPLPARSTREFRILSIMEPYIAAALESYAITYDLGHDADWTIYGGDHAPVLAVSLVLDDLGDAEAAIAGVGKAVSLATSPVYTLGEDAESVGWRLTWQNRAESLLARWETLSGRNEIIADAMAANATDPLISQIDELAKSSPAEASALGKKWFREDDMRSIIVEPVVGAASATPVSFTPTGHAHGTAVDGTLADRPLPVPYSPRPGIVRYTTENGLRVVLWNHGTAQLVHGRLVVGSGRAHEPTGREGTASYTGAGEIEADSLIMSERALSTQIDDVIESLGWELRSPGYELSEKRLEILRKELGLGVRQEVSKFEDEWLTALYGPGHPYARLAVTSQSAAAISRDSVMDWARDHVVPANSTLVLAGTFDIELVKKHITYQTDQVSAKSDSPDIRVAPKPTGKRTVAGVASRPMPSLVLQIGFVSGEGLDQDHGKRLVLEGVLQSMLSQLRTDRALTYGTTVAYQPRMSGGLWTISTAVDATRAGEAMQTIVETLNALWNDPEAMRAAFVLARQKVLEGLLVSTASSEAVVEHLALLAQFGEDEAFDSKLVRDIAGLTLAPFHTFAQTELMPNRMVVGAYGPKAAVEAALAAVE